METCDNCKYYGEGIDVDYIPHKYCKISRQISPIKCNKYNSNYTFVDWIEECFLGLFIIFLLILFFIFYNLL